VAELQDELSWLIKLAWSAKSAVPHTQNHHPMYWLEEKQCLRLVEIEEKLSYLDVRNPPADVGVLY